MLSPSIIRRLFSTKNIYFGLNARKRISEGCELVAKTVEQTLGPGGRNVCMEYEVGLPKITKDGVTVAKNILTTCNEVRAFFTLEFLLLDDCQLHYFLP